MIELAEDTVHLWHAGLAVSDAEYEYLGTVLDEREWVRARRFRSEAHRRNFVSCRGQLKCLLSCYLPVDPGSVGFTVGEYGKPRLANMRPDQGLVFNLSHSGPHALFALGQDLMLGVDIEIWRELSTMSGMVERCFAPVEQQYWSSVGAARRTSVFYANWTRKESFVKAVGDGISLGLDQCVIGLEPRLHFARLPGRFGDASEWSLLDIEVGRGLSAALAMRHPLRRVFYGELPRQWWRDGCFASTACRIK